MSGLRDPELERLCQRFIEFKRTGEIESIYAVVERLHKELLEAEACLVRLSEVCSDQDISNDDLAGHLERNLREYGLNPYVTSGDFVIDGCFGHQGPGPYPKKDITKVSMPGGLTIKKDGSRLTDAIESNLVTDVDSEPMIAVWLHRRDAATLRDVLYDAEEHLHTAVSDMESSVHSEAEWIKEDVNDLHEQIDLIERVRQQLI